MLNKCTLIDLSGILTCTHIYYIWGLHSSPYSPSGNLLEHLTLQATEGAMDTNEGQEKKIPPGKDTEAKEDFSWFLHLEL